MKQHLMIVIQGAALGLALSGAALADATMHEISAKGVGKAVGTLKAEDTAQGLKITADLNGLPPGDHGFHVHQNPSCAPADKDGVPVAGLAAGGHYDPGSSSKHEGPSGHGHLGDLPVLKVGPDGKARTQLVAPRLKVADLEGRSFIIHEGADNYADAPKPLGGGGARIACGVWKK